jgi:hypothetical protein
MPDDPRFRTLVGLLREYVASPSLRHIQDPGQLHKVAGTILHSLDGASEPWRKWPPARDMLVRGAVDCWIPLDDLHAALGELPGPPLTGSDVRGRLLPLWDEGLDHPEETLRTGCEALYAQEKAAGTELAAIIQLMKDWVGEEYGRRMHQEWEERERRRAELKAAAEQVLLSGADCKWTQIGSSADLYCRVNRRTYRLAKAADKKLEVWRVQSMGDAAGRLIGRYQGRPDATHAVGLVAYQPEPRR